MALNDLNRERLDKTRRQLICEAQERNTNQVQRVRDQIRPLIHALCLAYDREEKEIADLWFNCQGDRPEDPLGLLRECAEAPWSHLWVYDQPAIPWRMLLGYPMKNPVYLFYLKARQESETVLLAFRIREMREHWLMLNFGKGDYRPFIPRMIIPVKNQTDDVQMLPISSFVGERKHG